MKKVTMEDVAREANCSRAQVSRVFSGKSYVAEDLRKRILDAVKHLDYRNRANRHRIRIAVPLQGFSGTFTAQLLDALCTKMIRRKWMFSIIPEQEKQLIADRFYDGVLCPITSAEWARKWAEERSLPLVMINSYGTAFDRICTIDPDTYDEAYQVLRHLKELGHRRIARFNFSGMKRGADGFLKAAADLNLSGTVQNFQICDRGDMRPPPLHMILKQGFTALFVIHQHLAVRAGRIIQELGFRIPEDVSLVTYENPGVSEYLTPPHTTLNFNFSAIADRALDELRLRILGKEGTGGVIAVPNKLTVRGSTGPVRRESASPENPA